MRSHFRISHPKEEGMFQASKWISFRVLLDETEMESLLNTLSPFSFYNVSEIVQPDQAIFSASTFLSEYTTYVQALKKGTIYQPPKALFSSVISREPEALYGMDVKKGIILKILKPVVQISLHHFNYSPEDHSFYFMVHSKEAIQWGLQFSYPQLYSNSRTGDVIEVMKDHSYPNTELFRSLRKWMRGSSRPVPFLCDGKRVNVEARIGNGCFDWIDQHPQLKEKGLALA